MTLPPTPGDDRDPSPQPQAPQYPQAPPHPYAQPPVAPMSSLAVVAFVGSFFVSLVGMICGHIALARIKRSGQRGRGLALAGTIIGYVTLASKLSLLAALFVFGLGFQPGPVPTVSGASASGVGPEGMASGGAVFGEGGELVSSGSASGDSREAPEADRSAGSPVDVTVYVDYMCPACGAFEQANGDMLNSYVRAGDITLQVYPLNFLDQTSLGARYSTRAANLFACIVESSPDAALDVHTSLLSADVQPSEGTEGLTDDELLAVAEDAGADVDGELRQCVAEQRFAGFFDDNTRIATEEGLLGLAPGAQLLGSGGTPQPADGPQRLVSTPTVIVAGEQYVAQRDGDLESAILKALDR
ncbi:thioredoxin domain-containing protein [Leucobacter ruminantium]|nr:thioredoxin domain-containing protein [Leucobacter ruminantium]